MVYLYRDKSEAQPARGRDVTNGLSVIYNYGNQLVVLLARPHYYEMQTWQD